MIYYKFFIDHGFILEMIITAALFVYSFKRKKFFMLYLVFAVAFLFGFSIVWNIIFKNSPITWFLRYTIIFFAVVFCIWLCFDVKFRIALFCGIGAYATQHLAYKIGSTLQSLTQPFFNVILSTILYLTVIVIVYIASFFIFASRIKRNQAQYIENKQIIILSIALILITTIFQAFLDIYKDNLVLPLILIIAFYDVSCSVFTLCLQYGMFKSGKLRQDYKVMEHIVHLQKAQFESSKENIDLINIKCHDLKHQIGLLEVKTGQKELNDLKNILSIYDSSFKTGTEALDVILAGKHLYCEMNNIKLDCMANGEILNFMSQSDIYTLFGNAIDNAIEAVSQIEDKDNRIISLAVKESIGMVSIHIENNFNSNVEFVDGLPTTTKGDTNFHGFGTRSIRMLVEKYKGNLTFGIDDNVFNLNILFAREDKKLAREEKKLALEDKKR